MSARSRLRASSAAVLAHLLVVATTACSGADGDVVTIFGPEVDADLERLQAVLGAFSEESGIPIVVEGSRDFDGEIGSRVGAGDPPDIALFPQPGRVRELRDQLEPLPSRVVEMVEDEGNFDEALTELVRVDGDLVAVPVKLDLKSVVWYSPRHFAEAGYEVPQTFEELLALADDMVADGNPAFCVGIESGQASGWPLTDWIEDFLLRVEGPELYDRWVRHEVPFDHPEVVAVARMVADLWSQEGFVYGGAEAPAVTPFADAGLPLLRGECMMHRQASFYLANWDPGLEVGPDGDVDAFPLPGSEDHPGVTLSGGLFATAFDDDPSTQRVLEHMASAEYATAMVRRQGSQDGGEAQPGGFISPNRNVEITAYPGEVMQSFARILFEADPIRFDGSDLMPGVVGSGTFWTAAVDITVGREDVATAFAEVEANWPEE